MCEVRIVPEGVFWSVTVDSAGEDRQRFPTLESAVAWSLRQALRGQPATVTLQSGSEDMVLVEERALARP